MKKYLTALALLALVTANAANAQTTTPVNNPSANGSVQTETSTPAAKAGEQGTVKKAKTHKKKSVKADSVKTDTGSDTTVETK